MSKSILFLSLFALGCASPVAGAMASASPETPAPTEQAVAEMPDLSCTIEVERSGSRLSLRALAQAKDARTVSYLLEIVKDGPDGSTRNRQRGDVDLAKGETVLGEATISYDRKDVVTAHLSLEDADGTTLCAFDLPEDI